MQTKHVVSSFLMYKNRILIMKRSDKVSTYQGYWAVAAGYLEEEDSEPLERALIEVAEETGISELRLVKQGKPFEFVDKELQTKWVVHPFLFKVENDDVKLDWEHDEFKWIKPDELENYKIAPNLDEGLKRVL